jgi:anaerobic magnesium-protoporphyrin IX monomethyl ester cyclase
MKIALVNPPAVVRMIRDYYCSKTSKSTYLFAPADLLMQSGMLGKDNELVAIDAVAEGLNAKKCLERLGSFRPSLALGLIGAVSLKEDLAFYEALKGLVPECRIFLSGEPVLEGSEDFLKQNPFAEGVLLRFVSPGIAQYLNGESEPEGLVLRKNGEIKSFPISTAAEYSVGRTRQELFQHSRYFFSFAKSRRFATFLTDFGCPYKCGFCVMASLGYRRRDLAEIEEELDYLSWLGVKELFLEDQSFGAVPGHGKKVMELFQKFHNSYTAFVRPDQGDLEFWKSLKDSGCHTAIMGLESAVPEILSAYKKGYDRENIGQGVRLAKQAGLRVVTTVIIGLPEDTRESIGQTMKFLRELEPDFVSYNLAVPRSLTELRKTVLSEGLATNQEMDQAGSFSALRTRTLTGEELVALKRKAVRDFYLRPGYIGRRMAGAKSAFDLYAFAREGLSVLGKNI